MRGNLLGTDCFVECLEVVEVSEVDGLRRRVVRVRVTLAHLRKVLLIIALAILRLIFWLLPMDFEKQSSYMGLAAPLAEFLAWKAASNLSLTPYARDMLRTEPCS